MEKEWVEEVKGEEEATPILKEGGTPIPDKEITHIIDFLMSIYFCFRTLC